MTKRKSARCGPAYSYALRAPPPAGPQRKNRTDHVLHKPDIFRRSQHNGGVGVFERPIEHVVFDPFVPSVE